MLSQFYTKTQNRVNFNKKYPNHGVKCSFCELIFPVDQIQTHIATHISPQYMAPNTKNNQIKKMGRPKLFLQEKQNESMQSAIKAVKRDNIPRTQNVRKQKSSPSNLVYLPSNQVSSRVSLQNQPQKIHQVEMERTFQIFNLQKSFIEKEEIQQDMILGKQNVQVKKSSLQVYAAQKPINKRSSFNSTQLSWANSTRIQSKKRQSYKAQDSINETQTQAYQISQKTRSRLQQILPIFKTQSVQKFQVKIQKHKAPEVRSQSICTKSNKTSQLKRNSSFKFLAAIFGCSEAPKDLQKGQVTVNMDNTASTTQFYRSENVSPRKNVQHQCHGCGGFYCSTCHSTIPPQYRPSNISQKRDQKASQFYEKFIYGNKCDTSRVQNRKSEQCRDCNN